MCRLINTIICEYEEKLGDKKGLFRALGIVFKRDSHHCEWYIIQ